MQFAYSNCNNSNTYIEDKSFQVPCMHSLGKTAAVSEYTSVRCVSYLNILPSSNDL